MLGVLYMIYCYNKMKKSKIMKVKAIENREYVQLLTMHIIELVVKGAGGSEVNFHFFIVSKRGECQLPGTFFGMKKYCS